MSSWGDSYELKVKTFDKTEQEIKDSGYKVPEITYKEEYLRQLGEFLAKLKNIKALDVLPYHDMAIAKYENMGLEYPLKDTLPLTKEEAIRARNIIITAMRNFNKNK